MVGPAAFFPQQEACLHQMGDSAVGIAPIQLQISGELCLGAARVLAHVDHREQLPAPQAQLLKLLPGIGGKVPIAYGGEICQGIKHKNTSQNLTKSSIKQKLDEVKKNLDDMAKGRKTGKNLAFGSQTC